MVNVRHDVFKYIFKGKGSPSKKAGCVLLSKDDFSRCNFFNKECNDWDEYIDSLGDGTRISFPVRAKPFLTWGPKTHKLVNGKIVSKPRYHLEKVSLKWYYDENRTFPIAAILKHKKVACVRRIMLFTIFKYLSSFQRYSSFQNMQISSAMTSYTQPNFDQI